MFIIRSRRIVTPTGIRDAGVVVDEGKIVDIINAGAIPSDLPVTDVGEVVVSPGLVDTHVHVNEPGRTEWEGFETATKAGAAGGVTTLVDMPLNSSPVTTTVEAFTAKLIAATGKLHVDCGFYVGLVPGNASSIQSLLKSGGVGVKAFLVHSGIDEFPNVDESDLRIAIPSIIESGLPLLIHAELQTSISQSRTSNPRMYSHYLNSRPRTWENDAIALMVRLCKEFGCRVHIVHLSSSEAVSMLRLSKSAGLPITVETCPHYLSFASEEIPDGATQFKCAPPIRERENNEKLWNALNEGIIDCIVSDHSPCPPAMKMLEEGNFEKAWGGISSLQFGLSVVWTEARKRGFQIADISKWMSLSTSKLVGFEKTKGSILPGYDADLVVWDPEESFVVEPSITHHRHTLTPYAGRTLFGKVLATYVRGKRVYYDGNFSAPCGNILLKN